MTGSFSDLGAVLRRGRGPDRTSLLELIELQHDPTDVPEAAMVFDDPAFGPEGWLVAAHGDRVVACIAPFENRVRIGRVELAGLEIEFVTSHPSVAGRGLIRRLFAMLAGTHPNHLVHLMVGIPYFYRRLGYEYAIPSPPEQVIDEDQNLTLPSGWEFISVDSTYIDALQAAQADMSDDADVAFAHTDTRWRWLLASPNYTTLRACSGEEQAFARIHDWKGDAYMFDIVARSPDGLEALAAAARSVAGGSLSLLLRPALREIAAGVGETASQDYAYYAKVTDPVAALEALRPELSARLQRSDQAGAAGRLLISFYTSSVTLEYDRGAIGPVRPGDPERAPVAAGGAGVPPDLIATLLLGPDGFTTMARRHPDVLAGQAAGAVMGALFPPQTVDVQSWVYP